MEFDCLFYFLLFLRFSSEVISRVFVWNATDYGRGFQAHKRWRHISGAAALLGKKGGGVVDLFDG